MTIAVPILPCVQFVSQFVNESVDFTAAVMADSTREIPIVQSCEAVILLGEDTSGLYGRR